MSKVAGYNLFQGQVKVGQVKVPVGETIYGKKVTEVNTAKRVVGGAHVAVLKSITDEVKA